MYRNNQHLGIAHATTTAKDQIQQVEKIIPEVKDEWEEAKARFAKIKATIEEHQSRIALMKEKIAVSRYHFF